MMRAFAFLASLTAMVFLGACGSDAPSGEPDARVQLREPFTAATGDLVPLVASVEESTGAEHDLEWRVIDAPPGSTPDIQPQGPRTASLQVSADGEYTIEAALTGTSASDRTVVTFASDFQLPTGVGESPAPYVEPEVRTVSVLDPSTGQAVDQSIATFGDVAVYGDAVVGTVDENGSLEVQATYRESSLFPSSTIPYAFDPLYFSAEEEDDIREWLGDIEQKTVLDFQEVSYFNLLQTTVVFSQNQLWRVAMGHGCWAEKTPVVEAGRRIVNLGSSLDSSKCMKERTVKHEVLHAIGLFHEHQRNDRDEYLDLTAPQGIAHPGWVLNFQQPIDNIDHPTTGYDWASIMHYEFGTYRDLFGDPYAVMDAENLDEVPSGIVGSVGRSSNLSAGDIAAIDALYGKGGSATRGIWHFDGDGKNDVPGGASWQLENAEFRFGRLVLDGIYEHSSSPDAELAIVNEPSIARNRFTLAVRFNADPGDPGRWTPVIVGGRLYRWFGARLQDGRLSITINNNERAFIYDNDLDDGWHTLFVNYDHATRMLRFQVDDGLLQAVDLGSEFAWNVWNAESEYSAVDTNLTFHNYSYGRAFGGEVDWVLWVNDVLAPADVVRIMQN